MSRNLGRALVLLAIAGVILSLGWWAIYYNEIIRPLGMKGGLTHPMRCLLWTADVCGPPQVVKLYGVSLQAYTPIAMWAALAVLLLGLLVVWRSPSPQPYPQTPAGEPKLIVPKLEPFYAWVRDLSWPLIRVAAGGTLLTFGLTKIMSQDVATFAARSMAGRGIEPALLFAYLIYFLETGGAILIMIGLFTRLIASALAIEFFVITFVAQFQVGYGTARGWSMLLMWGLIFFAIALRGGGPYSLDRAIRREL